MLQWKILRTPWLLLFWFGLMNVLFFLPGSAFPKETWLTKIYFDKWVHIGLFFVLLFLGRAAMAILTWNGLALLLLAAIGYGIGVEWVQEHWVVNRSFDAGDIVADTAGALLGSAFWWWVYKKNKPL